MFLRVCTHSEFHIKRDRARKNYTTFEKLRLRADKILGSIDAAVRAGRSLV